MTREEVAGLLKRIQAIYTNMNFANPSATLDEWARFLEPFPADAIHECLNLYVAEGHPFGPNVGELIQMGRRVAQRQSEDMSAAEAWALVSRALQNGIYGAEKEFGALPERVQKAVGSPDQLRNMAMDPEYNEGVQKGIFLKQYEAQLRREQDIAALPSTLRGFVLDISEKVGIENHVD